MKYSELQPRLQNLTNENITLSKIADVLNVSKQNIHKRVTKVKKDVPADEIAALENFFNVSLSDEIIEFDYYPDVYGSCGYGSMVLCEDMEKIKLPAKLIKNYSKLKKYSVITAKGESMIPFIYNRDKLIVEHWQGGQIQDNQVYVFSYDGELYVKRIVNNIDEIVIKSDNPSSAYRDRFIQKNSTKEFRVIGEIIGLIRDMRM